MVRRGLRYGGAAGSSLALVGLLALVAGGSASQFLFVPVLGVAAVALAAGVGPGLLSAATTAAACAVLLYPGPMPPLEAVRLAGVGATAVAIAWAAGSVRGAYERAAAERHEAEEARRRAERAARLRDEVLAAVSHDLKSPLASISLAADVLERRGVRQIPDLARPVAALRKNVASMSRLIHDLLDVASIEAGRLSVQRQRQDLAELAGEALARARDAAADAGVALAARVEPAEVECDGQRLLQVLANLVGNAIKATPPGGSIAIEASRRDGQVEVSVADTGRGIPPDELPHVFDRFRRGRNAGYDGSGLGLAIVKGIVEAHGGAVRAESVPGTGTRVSFTLPAPPPASAKASGPTAARAPAPDALAAHDGPA
jgi:signal transduction histidine kinase